MKVFYNIDYIMITIRMMIHDYEHLARCMVPIDEEQLKVTMEDRVAKRSDRSSDTSEHLCGVLWCQEANITMSQSYRVRAMQT